MTHRCSHNPMFCDVKQQGMLLIVSLDGTLRHYNIKKKTECLSTDIYCLSYFSSSVRVAVKQAHKKKNFIFSFPRANPLSLGFFKSPVV